MVLPNPAIEHHVSSVLVVVSPRQSVAEAARLMREHRIRHLPVVDADRPVGVLSDRDVRLIEGLRGVDSHQVTIQEAMSPVLYLVDPEAPVHLVALDMAERRYGCAVVARGQRLYGLFTTTDALRTLAFCYQQTIQPGLEGEPAGTGAGAGVATAD